ncbi:uncharacterized protein BKCO1_7000179 [Diplodia corticola]|uniref:Uncharacterized protein n=1 Tax=Diplodia corticola TaxID=236234 RepID=A0A1J9SCV5_9PEZI|nr:uncharacterized protein BKCO1_7000179 [Diplodia corticola]OJD37405.1 hypothetical protein BKCO1_7000179 [Diplodia corticola]
MPSLSAGISSLNAGYISTTQQNRTSPYMPGGEPRPGNSPSMSDKAVAARKARLEQFDREVAEARERREEREREKKGGSKKMDEREGDEKAKGQVVEVDCGGDEKEHGGFRQGLKDKIFGRRE